MTKSSEIDVVINNGDDDDDDTTITIITQNKIDSSVEHLETGALGNTSGHSGHSGHSPVCRATDNTTQYH